MLNSLCEQYGARRVLKDIQDFYPAMFQEINTQLHRLKPEKQIPVLFMKKE